MSEQTETAGAADSSADAQMPANVTVDAQTVIGEQVQIYSDKSVNVTVTGEGYTPAKQGDKTVWTKSR